MATDVQRGGNVDPGADDSSTFSMDYARAKMREFQGMLNVIDATAQALRDALQWASDAESSRVIGELLDEYDSRKGWMRTTAEALNASAAAINALGGRLPSLSIPGGLGGVPILGLAGIIATAATLTSWGLGWIATADDRIRALADARVSDARIEAARNSPDPAGELAVIARERDAVNETIARLESARGGLTSLPGQFFDLVKLAAIGVAGYVIWRALQARRDVD